MTASRKLAARPAAKAAGVPTRKRPPKDKAAATTSPAPASRSDPPTGGQPAPLASIGSALLARRKRLGLTLQALAAKSSLSAPFISQVERGQAAPSIISLLALAKALGVDISYFLTVPKPSQIVRRGSKPELIQTGLPPRYVRLSGKHEERKLEALLIEVPAGLGAPTATRDGEGFWYVLDGRIDMTVGDETFTLDAGDSAHFDQRHPYSMRNNGSAPVRMLWVGTPALF